MQDCAVLRTYYKRRRIVVVREGVLVATGCSFLATGLCKLDFRLAHHDGEDRRSGKRQGQAVSQSGGGGDSEGGRMVRQSWAVAI